MQGWHFTGIRSSSFTECAARDWEKPDRWIERFEGAEISWGHLRINLFPSFDFSDLFTTSFSSFILAASFLIRNQRQKQSLKGWHKPLSSSKKECGKKKDRHTDTQTHRHTDTQTHRHTDTRTHGHTDTRTHGHTDTRTHGHTDTRTHGHTDTRTHGHTDTRTHRHTDTQTQTQTHRHTDTQTHRHTAEAGSTLKGKRKKKADTDDGPTSKTAQGGEGNRRTSGTNLHGETDLPGNRAHT